MKQTIICTECPNGCSLEVILDQQQVSEVSGNQCARGQSYAIKELQSPERYFTTTVQCQNLALTVAPVRTTKPIPKEKMNEAITQAQKIVLAQPMSIGTVIKKDFIIPGVNLILTRSINKKS